jgi:hypothetical protein
MVQPPQLTLWNPSPLVLTRVSWFFPCPGGLSRGEAPPLHKGAGGSQRPQLALWDMSAPPPLSLFPPRGTNPPLQAKWPAQFHESRTYCKPGLREDAIKPFGLSGQATPVSAGVTARLWTPATW